MASIYGSFFVLKNNMTARVEKENNTLLHRQRIDTIPEDFAGDIWPEITVESIRGANHLLTAARVSFRTMFDLLRQQGKLLPKAQNLSFDTATDPHTKAAYRCQGRITHIGLDCDGTINGGFTYSSLIPGSPKLEEAINGTTDVRKWIAAFVQYVQPHLANNPELFHKIGRKVMLRPGIVQLFDFCLKHNIAIDIFSRQFKPIVEGQLSILPTHIIKNITSARIHAITPYDVTAVYKGVNLLASALQNGQSSTGAGDSLIDLTMFGPTKNVMTAFFVLDGTQLARELQAGVHPVANDIPILPFADGYGILRHIKEIGRRGESLGLIEIK